MRWERLCTIARVWDFATIYLVDFVYKPVISNNPIMGINIYQTIAKIFYIFIFSLKSTILRFFLFSLFKFTNIHDPLSANRNLADLWCALQDFLFNLWEPLKIMKTTQGNIIYQSTFFVLVLSKQELIYCYFNHTWRAVFV